MALDANGKPVREPDSKTAIGSVLGEDERVHDDEINHLGGTTGDDTAFILPPATLTSSSAAGLRHDADRKVYTPAFHHSEGNR